jgi:cytoskeletal protein CcmA (bactofilin family)
MRHTSFLFFIFLTVLALLLFGAAQSGFALIARSSESIQISADEVLDEDLYLAGNSISVEGTVRGNLYAAGQTVAVSGNVSGNVVVFSQKAVLSGRVGEGVKAFGQSVTVSGDVAGDVIVAGNAVYLDKTMKLDGDAIIAARKWKADGQIKGEVLGAGRTVTISGPVNGNVRLAVSSLTIASTAHIGGSLMYVSQNEAAVQPGSRIDGSVSRRTPEFKERLKEIFPFLIVAGITAKIFGFLMAVVVGLVVVLLFPKWVWSATDSIAEKPGACVGWGALILFATPGGILVAAFTVAGISLAVITLFVYLIAVYMSQIVVGALIGRLIIGRNKTSENRGILFGAFVLGMFLIRLFRFIPVFGSLICVVAALFGLGSIVVTFAACRKGINQPAS